MKYYIISGEASGDLHASNLMAAIKLRDQQAQFRAWGGDLMQKQGAEIVKHYRDLAFMGFLEVVLNLTTILRNIRFCKQDILQWKPDVLILVDYPGFNMRMAKFAHQQGFKVVYYISPQIWAWKKSRVHAIKKFVDKMLVILPFEKAFYAKYDYSVEFVGNPILDALPKEPLDTNQFRAENKLGNKPIIALLPGSRKQEIAKMLSVMLKMVDQFPEYEFAIAGAPSIEDDFYFERMASTKVVLIKNNTQKLLQASYAALVTSGTATLETALLNVPEVVCYKGSQISYQIAKQIVDIPFISLVNLIMNTQVVKELIQNDFTEQNLKTELNKLLSDTDHRTKMLLEYQHMKTVLGEGGASARAAAEVLKILKT